MVSDALEHVGEMRLGIEAIKADGGQPILHVLANNESVP